jgi:hypothetical protein
MSTEQTAPKNIDEYIAGFPEDVRERLKGLRRVVHAGRTDLKHDCNIERNEE